MRARPNPTLAAPDVAPIAALRRSDGTVARGDQNADAAESGTPWVTNAPMPPFIMSAKEWVTNG